MKLDKNILLPPFLSVLSFLLVCLLITVLYAFDLINTHIYESSCLFTGCIVYLIFGILFQKSIKKRQLVIAFCITVLLLVIHIFNLGFTKELLQKAFKLLFFLGTVLFLKLKRHS